MCFIFKTFCYQNFAIYKTAPVPATCLASAGSAPLAAAAALAAAACPIFGKGKDFLKECGTILKGLFRGAGAGAG
ncbi:hypothetical protein NPIL_640981 [Nephila pilipes]|uniref:Uncharacterized protein n=1 Tax=Nephila pilipes TaxID=299642 RepID=A0A8X6NDA2_NEPPI|nr:hypothetical protein NPIL_640981 [Nephila pilipes]